MIKEFIAHDDTKNSIYRFPRTAEILAKITEPGRRPLARIKL
jgi:hypothetical protein